MSKKLPRGVLNRNPGNLERGSDRWLGMSQDQSSDSRFLVFDTDEAGIRALMRVLINYQERHGICTVRKAIDRWAPAVENNTNSYVQHVSRMTGFDPDEKLDFLDRYVCVQLTKAIVRHENGPADQHGRPEFWYDEPTYDRAAVMAGFEPELKPLVKSREITGGAVAAVGALGTLAAVMTGAPVVEATVTPITPEDISLVVGAIGALAGPSMLAYASPIATLLGAAYAIWARYDSSRRKLR